MTFFRREGENPMKHFGSYLTIAGTVPIVARQNNDQSVRLTILLLNSKSFCLHSDTILGHMQAPGIIGTAPAIVR